MTIQWFTCHNEEVHGPFSTEDIKSQITNGVLTEDSSIWGKPQNQWMTPKRWLETLAETLEQWQDQKENRLWHFALNGESHGPLTRPSLIAELKNHDVSQIMLWTKGMRSWAPIFEFHDILDELGVNRRKHPRADIQGKLILKSEEQTLIGNLVVVSEGGFGAAHLFGVTPGQVYSAELQSEHFGQPIHVRAEARYQDENGFTGFRFQNINVESKSRIIQYVKAIGPKQEAA